jgi:pimeloyl-ACP methyl ester carboxylesterase
LIGLDENMACDPSDSEPASRFYVSQRQRLHYVDWGNETAPPLVLMHGGRDHCRSWDWVAADLRRDWHVIAPDLRGHGDSAWSLDGSYSMPSFVYDLAELIHQVGYPSVDIVAHSLGGNIALRYAAIYPENIRRIVAVEGLGASPAKIAIRQEHPITEHMRTWIEDRRGLAVRQVRRYKSIDEACRRMLEENGKLSPDQALHLTKHGLMLNEDETFSWKFDNYVRYFAPTDFGFSQPSDFWNRIRCPTLLVNGADSWASDPVTDGSVAHFRNVSVSIVEGAGHWVHHDRLDSFLSLIRQFLV